MAHTLDGIDGKQARRTGSSSPLGEMFDHGLDSWSTSLFLINFISRKFYYYNYRDLEHGSRTTLKYVTLFEHQF